MGEKSGSGINFHDNFYDCIETIFRVKKLKFFDADPYLEKFGSGIKKSDPQQ
jgi:hypothetical protein